MARVRVRNGNREQRMGWWRGTGVRAHLRSQPNCTGSLLGDCTGPSPHPRRNGGPQGGRATARQQALSHSVTGRRGGHYSGRSAGEGEVDCQGLRQGLRSRPWLSPSLAQSPPVTMYLILCSTLPREPLVRAAETSPQPHPHQPTPLTVRKCKARGRLVLTVSAVAT